MWTLQVLPHFFRMAVLTALDDVPWHARRIVESRTAGQGAVPASEMAQRPPCLVAQSFGHVLERRQENSRRALSPSH